MELPIEVLREALVHALAHHDYTIVSPIRVIVFADRVEIHTPGQLPNGVAIDSIRLGVHVLRAEPETFQPCRASVKPPPGDHEMQGDRLACVCSASAGCDSSGPSPYWIRGLSHSPGCFYGTDHARRSFSRAPSVSPGALNPLWLGNALTLEQIRFLGKNCFRMASYCTIISSIPMYSRSPVGSDAGHYTCGAASIAAMTRRPKLLVSSLGSVVPSIFSVSSAWPTDLSACHTAGMAIRSNPRAGQRGVIRR